MLAFVTGASAGIGKAIAQELSKRGFDLILVARRADRLESLKRELSTDVCVVEADLSRTEECQRVCALLQDKDVDIAVNCAGFGVCGAFSETDLGRETDMIQVNICALHVLTKFFVRHMKERGGTILNVASVAAFLPGPYMATYYATKAYVLRLSCALREELKHSGVRVCTFCPGPVKTEFDHVAGVRSSLNGMDCQKAARYAVKHMLRGSAVILPGLSAKLARVAAAVLPDALLARCAALVQTSKLKSK